LKLAINGGKPVRTKLFPAHVTIGNEERKAVDRVLRSGILSKYLGSWHENFYGGREVQALELEWARYFKVKHAIAVNSATSGLYIAVGAIGAGPGDEVITTPFTMSATAASILVFNAIPVFADIEEDYYCISAKSISDRITQRTKAIIAVDLFGQPYDAENIKRIAKKRGLYIIEDCAQSPGALFEGRYAGTVSDIGVFSLNYHKHIHCGEGGVVVTNDGRLAERMRLIRNHAEAVVGDRNIKDLVNMLGFNFRMTEMQAAIVRCQLKKLKNLVNKRIENVHYLERKLRKIPAIEFPKVREGCTHVYYQHAMKFKEEQASIDRDTFVNAVKAELPALALRENEGPQIGTGYCKPLYLQPLYQNKILYGKSGCPFNCKHYPNKASYYRGLCKIAEKMHFKELFSHELIHPFMERKDLDDVATAFHKVWEGRKTLRRGRCEKKQ
jgi:perosamine synthetase